MTDPLQEDRGLVKIYDICIKMSAIWRPTPCHDLGIDGQIEFLEPGTSISTGNIIAVQSKSGPSYFENQDDRYVKYYPKDRHRKYWKRIKLPVILILYNPEIDIIIYTRVKPQLNQEGPILLEKSSIFSSEIRESLLYEFNKDYEEFIEKSSIGVLESFRRITLLREDTKEITGIEFLIACTNRQQQYFELRMCRIKAIFYLLTENSFIGIGHDDYDFILRNVLQCHAQRIVPDFLEEFDYSWYDLSMVPDISVPLTSFGIETLEYLYANINNYLDQTTYIHLNIPNVFSLAEYISSTAQASSDRLDASDRLPEEPRG